MLVSVQCEFDVDYAYCWTPHVAHLRSTASPDGSARPYSSLVSRSHPGFHGLHCVELQCNDIKQSLFSSTCSCSNSASPEGIAHLSIHFQGWKSCFVLMANKNSSGQLETCIPGTHTPETCSILDSALLGMTATRSVSSWCPCHHLHTYLHILQQYYSSPIHSLALMCLAISQPFIMRGGSRNETKSAWLPGVPCLPASYLKWCISFRLLLSPNNVLGYLTQLDDV